MDQFIHESKKGNWLLPQELICQVRKFLKISAWGRQSQSVAALESVWKPDHVLTPGLVSETGSIKFANIVFCMLADQFFQPLARSILSALH